MGIQINDKCELGTLKQEEEKTHSEHPHTLDENCVDNQPYLQLKTACSENGWTVVYRIDWMHNPSGISTSIQDMFRGPRAHINEKGWPI